MLLVKTELEEGDSSQSPDCWVLPHQVLGSTSQQLFNADSMEGMTDRKLHLVLVRQSV
jgi:hypothetical protein